MENLCLSCKHLSPYIDSTLEKQCQINKEVVMANIGKCYIIYVNGEEAIVEDCVNYEYRGY